MSAFFLRRFAMGLLFLVGAAEHGFAQTTLRPASALLP